MPKEQELRDAIVKLRLLNRKSVDMVCDFAESVLSSDGWPKPAIPIHNKDGSCLGCEVEGYNRAIKYCRIASAKREIALQAEIDALKTQIEKLKQTPDDSFIKHMGKPLNIYLISQNINDNYDSYEAAVVVAETEEEARNTNPSNGQPNDNEFNSEEHKYENYDNWVKTEFVKAEKIGTTRIRSKGVILASDNAG